MDSLKIGDAAAAAVAVAPRVELKDIEAAIAREHYTTADHAVQTISAPLSCLTLCIIELRNGFTVVGKSACASPANFNADLGKKFAREDAIREIWKLMGFALRDRLAAQA